MGYMNEQNILIRQAAAAMGCSVSELARRINCNRRTIANWQAGKSAMPGPARLLLGGIAAGKPDFLDYVSRDRHGLSGLR